MAGLKRGGAAAHERAVVDRDGRGTAGKNTSAHTHTPVSVTHVHKAKTKATLKEERAEREHAARSRRCSRPLFVSWKPWSAKE